MPRRRATEQEEARLHEHGRALADATREAAAAARALVDDVEILARAELRERPLLALGAAFAAGWLLGGGVPARALGGVAGRAVLGIAAARLADLGASGAGARAAAAGPD